MGQKVNPHNFRIGILYGWKSKWFNQRKYREYLREDVSLREFLKNLLRDAAVEKIEIDRSGEQITIIIHSSRPGLIIGRQGDGIDKLKQQILRHLKANSKKQIRINIEEVRQPELSAQLVAHNVAEQLEKRVGFRRALKQSIERVMQAHGAEGVRINVAGRLDGGDMSRSEWLAEGKIPLQTLRAEIDFAKDVARTTFGIIGVKVWIYKGERFEDEETVAVAPARTPRPRPRAKRGERS